MDRQAEDKLRMTIDELARRASVPVSTLRMYQHRGLVPPPERRGRVGYYGEVHLDRLRAVARLQERGFSLAGIKELLDALASGDTLSSVVGLGAAPSIWAVEAPESMTVADLAARLPSVSMTPAVLRRVVELGLVEPSIDGSTVTVSSPSFLRIGAELAALGIPGEEILDEYERLRAETDEIAARFTDLFRRRMWRPFVRRRMPPDEVAPLLATLDQLAPLAEEITASVLRHSMRAAAESFVQRESRRLGVPIPRRAS